MYDAQVLSPIMSTNAVPQIDEKSFSSMTPQALKKAQDTFSDFVVGRRGEMSRTNENLVQQKSESVRYHLFTFDVYN